MSNKKNKTKCPFVQKRCIGKSCKYFTIKDVTYDFTFEEENHQILMSDFYNEYFTMAFRVLRESGYNDLYELSCNYSQLFQSLIGQTLAVQCANGREYDFIRAYLNDNHICLTLHMKKFISKKIKTCKMDEIMDILLKK